MAAADLRLAYVNTEKVIRAAPAAIKAGRKLEREFESRDRELKRLAADIQARQERLAILEGSRPEADIRASEREIREVSRQLERQQEDFLVELRRRQDEESSALIDKTARAIEEIAARDKLDLVLSDAVWVGEGADITDQLIKVLGGD